MHRLNILFPYGGIVVVDTKIEILAVFLGSKMHLDYILAGQSARGWIILGHPVDLFRGHSLLDELKRRGIALLVRCIFRTFFTS
jgi:hypothetical protein